MTRASYILTTKDRPDLLAKALARVPEFKGPDDELIVVDGGMPTTVAEESGVVDVLIQEPDESPNDALIKGIKAASGEFVKQLTDDDKFLSEGMEVVWKKMQDDPSLDMVMAGGLKMALYRLVPGQEPTASVVCVPLGSNYGHDSADVFKWGSSGVGHFLRRDFALDMKYSDKFLALDMEMAARAIKNGAKVRFIRADTFRHPIFRHSALAKHRERYIHELKILRKEYISDPSQYTAIGHHQVPPVWDGEIA